MRYNSKLKNSTSSLKKPTSLLKKTQAASGCFAFTKRRGYATSQNKKQFRFFNKSRAQVSMEYLMIVGFAMLLTAPLLLIYAQQTNSLNDHLQDSQSSKAADKIIDAVDAVFYTGEGAKRTIKVSFPEEVANVVINDNLLTINMDSGHGSYEVNRWSNANMTGSLKNHKGVHTIIIEHLGSQVSITEG